MELSEIPPVAALLHRKNIVYTLDDTANAFFKFVSAWIQAAATRW